MAGDVKRSANIAATKGECVDKISVIMLTYNRENLVAGMITCIQKQNFPNFELIIVDNGSTDKSGDIAERYAREDNRIRVIHRRRGNIGSGRNTGLDAATGEFIAFVDDDDSCSPDYLRFLYDLAIGNDADVSICGATWSNTEEKCIMTPEEAVITLLWRKKYNVAFPTKLFRRRLFENNRFLDTGKYDDISLMPKILANANKIAYHGLSKYHFNRHGNNNSAWTQNHQLLDAETLREYLEVYHERTIWLSKRFPNSADKWRYFNWSFYLSMIEKITRYALKDCYAIQSRLVEEIRFNQDEIIHCGYLQDYEKEYCNMALFDTSPSGKSKKIIIFGAGLIGQRLCIRLQQKCEEELLFFVDNNSALWDTTLQVNHRDYIIQSPEQILFAEYDKICICVKGAVNEIYEQCVKKLHVPEYKIDCTFLEMFTNSDNQRYLQSRNWFLENYLYIARENGIAGAVAEVGVFRGAFAKEINRCFSDRTLYLYDTFQGFDERDISQEKLLSADADSLESWRQSMGNFSNTSIDYVMSQMPHPEKCVIKKGFFPDTFEENQEQFAFVNLDCDLYRPIQAGLELFYPRMSKGGVILVHEYFDEIDFLPGIKKAVNDFAAEQDCILLPIGDRQSIAVMKPE